MTILSTFKTDMGGEFLLIQYGENHFSYGARAEYNTICGAPIQQCGTKEEVINRCKRLIELKNKNIDHYKKEIQKDKQAGWNILINNSQNQIEMFNQFIDVLKNV